VKEKVLTASPSIMHDDVRPLRDNLADALSSNKRSARTCTSPTFSVKLDGRGGFADGCSRIHETRAGRHTAAINTPHVGPNHHGGA